MLYEIGYPPLAVIQFDVAMRMLRCLIKYECVTDLRLVGSCSRLRLNLLLA
jgi:hypothetical protein